MQVFALTDSQKESLNYEVISNENRLKLTRLIRRITFSEDADFKLVRQNEFINIANTALGRPIYVLEADHMGEYYLSEYAWHNGELELIMRRPDTIKLIEILADMVQAQMLMIDDLNKILIEYKNSFQFSMNDANTVLVNVIPIEDINLDGNMQEHPNIRLLIKRMELSFSADDYAAVLHASASIFETLAKDVVGLDSVQNKSLGSFFEAYRKHSNLSDVALDFILATYKRRNNEPLAGHGSTQQPNINKDEASELVYMTKDFVRRERSLVSLQLEVNELTES